MLEEFLNKPEYNYWEINIPKVYINKNIKDLCEYVNQQERIGMKFIKVHLSRQLWNVSECMEVLLISMEQPVNLI